MCTVIEYYELHKDKDVDGVDEARKQWVQETTEQLEQMSDLLTITFGQSGTGFKVRRGEVELAVNCYGDVSDVHIPKNVDERYTSSTEITDLPVRPRKAAWTLLGILAART
jgi:oligoribonuclease (3'-5' exoribonuclease)